MNSSEIRQSFLKFFESKGHRIVSSSSLLPDAPNLLFTNAGMNPFVPYFLGERTPRDRRVTDTQKCMRAGGKHNDLEEVGLDTYHHTFFEMLGNWSFGDYFKQEAIQWAWELLTDVWKFPKHRLYATVYEPLEGEPAERDHEAYELWWEVFTNANLDPNIHIVYGHKKDNFWMMGDTGPCGSCSEIHVDLTPDGRTDGCLVNKGDARCIEIWNLVFMQYNALPNGSFELLKNRYVDTGMGLERVAGIFATTRNFTDFSRTPSNYDSDLFQPIFAILEQWSGHRYGGRVSTSETPSSPEEKAQLKADIAFRVIADHVRAATFAIADGIYPGNEGRNYVLRKIIRRAVYFGQKLGLHKKPEFSSVGFFARLAAFVVHSMGDVFPELENRTALLQKFTEEGLSWLKLAPTNTEGKRTVRSCAEAVLDEKKCLQDFSCGQFVSVPPVKEGIGSRDTATHTLKALIAKTLQQTGCFTKPFKEHPFKGSEVDDTVGKERALKIGNIEQIAERLSSCFLSCYPRFGLAQAVCEPLETEERLFKQTLDKGMRLLEQRLDVSGTQLSGKDAFLLYDTYGFPLALTQLIAKEHRITVDEEGFQNEMARQKERSRTASQKNLVQLVSSEDAKFQTHFVGYDLIQKEGILKTIESAVLDVIREKGDDGRDAIYVIVEQSPFYGEKGGQIGDSGVITLMTQPNVLPVKNTIWQGKMLLHEIEEGSDRAANFETIRNALLHKTVRLEVNRERRMEISRHHTATHLLQWALRQTLNPNLHQCGSSVTDERLRFDFNHYEKLSAEQLANVEQLVNRAILGNTSVTVVEKCKNDLPNDCIAPFGEKYGDVVRMVNIGEEKKDGLWLDNCRGSRELCGGTHVRRTGELGAFYILKESSVSAGIRRIEACVGTSAYHRYLDLKQRCETLETELQQSKKEKKNETADIVTATLRANVLHCLEMVSANINNDNGLNTAIACLSETVDIKTLRGVCSGIFKEQHLDVFTVACEKLLLVFCSERAIKKNLSANCILKHALSQCGGRGGGKEAFATGNVNDASLLRKLIKQPYAFEVVQSLRND